MIEVNHLGSVSRSAGPMSYDWTKTVPYLRKYAMTAAQTSSTSAWNTISSIHTHLYFHFPYSSVISCILFPFFIPAVPNRRKFVFRLQIGHAANRPGPRSWHHCLPRSWREIACSVILCRFFTRYIAESSIVSWHSLNEISMVNWGNVGYGHIFRMYFAVH